MAERCVALISGGKDSVAAVDVARQTGREVAVGLVMRPAEDDAWMFHVPNIDVAPAVAKCLGLEVVEAPARADKQLEVEDLEEALRQVRDEHGVTAIVSGALASEYQRTRIDRIGHRLGMKSYAPLWHKDPEAYMAPFARDAWEVRFSRVACDGLDEAWAGARIDADRLAALRSLRTRPHLAGEGGEYETLVLDAPCYASRIVVDSARVEATVSRATWVIEQFHVESK